MKATNRHDLVKAIAFLVSLFCIFVLFSCDPQDEPVPVVKTTKASVKIGIAENVKISSAKLTGVVVFKEEGTRLAFEYQTTNTAWLTKVLSIKFSSKDSVKVTCDLSDLQANTVYSFRLRAVSVAGDTVSTISTFKTYAVSDFDGNLYHTITIGTQTWLQENLKTTHFANGDAIPNVNDATAWSNLTTPAYCYYNNDAKNGEVYGALYNWYVGHDPRGLIIGYHVPTEKEFLAPAYFLAGNPADIALAYNPSLYDVTAMMMESGNAHWSKPKFPGTNTSGFTAVANGFFGKDSSSNKFEFMSLMEYATWWNNEEFNSYGISTVINSFGTLDSGNCYNKNVGLGIRLVK